MKSKYEVTVKSLIAAGSRSYEGTQCAVGDDVEVADFDHHCLTI